MNRKQVRVPEHIADSSHPIWKEIDREKAKMGQERWVSLLVKQYREKAAAG